MCPGKIYLVGKIMSSINIDLIIANMTRIIEELKINKSVCGKAYPSFRINQLHEELLNLKSELNRSESCLEEYRYISLEFHGSVV